MTPVAAGVPDSDRTLVIDTWCPGCGVTNSVAISPESFSAWQLGDALTVAAPYLTDEEREQLESGTCPDCRESKEDRSANNDEAPYPDGCA